MALAPRSGGVLSISVVERKMHVVQQHRVRVFSKMLNGVLNSVLNERAQWRVQRPCSIAVFNSALNRRVQYYCD